MKVVVHGNINEGIKKLKKKRQLEGAEHFEKLRSYPKPSERRRMKERTAVARLRNQIQRQGVRSGNRDKRDHQGKY